MPQKRDPTTEEIAAQARAAVERAIQRHIPGLRLPDDLIGELGATKGCVLRGLKRRYRPCGEIYQCPFADVAGRNFRPTKAKFGRVIRDKVYGPDRLGCPATEHSVSEGRLCQFYSPATHG
jgi:hypothetical protein